ncbi:MAG: hypothetical protein JOY64_03255 [Alphaproteobacteria bacterium]|nr:hypothetical protein [Alphaproteobacteria bacterium]
MSGPLVFDELLFRAYNLNATPKEISPFIVRVYGCRPILAPLLKKFGEIDVSRAMTRKVNKATGAPEGPPIPIKSLGRDFADFHLETRYVCRLKPRRHTSHEQLTPQWIRFKDNVENWLRSLRLKPFEPRRQLLTLPSR